MAKKCIYCSIELSNESVLDVCKKCGHGVWGEKMFNTIVKNMEEAREKGDLCHTEPLNANENPQEIVSDDMSSFSI